MDRRTRIIIFIIGTIILFGLVGWFIVWPTLKPVLPGVVLQPPALPTNLKPPTVTPTGSQNQQPNTPQPSGSGIATFQPVDNPDADTIAALARQAGVLAERVESGSSDTGFTNLNDAQLDVSPTLASTFQALQSDLRRAHPASGVSYVTVARRLVEKPNADRITGPTFGVTVDLQVQVRDNGTVSSGYREAVVTFTQSGDNWLPSGYTAKPYTPSAQ
jgi:hypothetical protein